MNLSQSFTQHYLHIEPEMSDEAPTPEESAPEPEKRRTFRFPAKQIEELQKRHREAQ